MITKSRLINTKLLSCFVTMMIMIVGGLIPFTSVYGQNMTSTVNTNNTNNDTNNEEQIAEDFKDCFLKFKSKQIYGFGQDLTNLIGIACYETYKSEGKFPHQMSKDESLNMTRTLNELTKASDLDDILRAFGQ